MSNDENFRNMEKMKIEKKINRHKNDKKKTFFCPHEFVIHRICVYLYLETKNNLNILTNEQNLDENGGSLIHAFMDTANKC